MADKVELSSIRVSAELDASRYKQGAADIAAANKAISDTSKQTDSNVVSLQTKISQSGDVLARLSRQYVDGYASAQRFNSALQQLSNGVERGRINMAQATPILDGIYRKYGLMADAAQFAARGQVELANAVQTANARLAQQQQIPPGAGMIEQARRQQAGANFSNALEASFAGTGKVARDSMAVFESELNRIDEIARLKGQQAGVNFAAGLEASFATSGKSARASMAVFEEVARDTELWAQKTALLKASLDPAAAAVERMNAEVAEYNEMLRRGTIDAEMFARAQQQSQQRHIGSQAGQGGLARFGSLNAAAQFQDIAVTSAMGQSPLTIALQQGTQLGQALESGMKAGAGLRGIVSGLAGAFTSLLTPANLVGIAFTAVAAVAIQFATKLIPATKSLKEATDDQRKAVDDLAKSYGVAGIEADKFGTKSTAAAAAGVRKQTEELGKALRDENTNVIDQLARFIPSDRTRHIAGRYQARSEFEAFAKPIQDYVKSLQTGHPDNERFVKDVNAIVATQPGLQGVADKMLNISGAAAQAADQIHDTLIEMDRLGQGVMGGRAPVEAENAQQNARAQMALEAESLAARNRIKRQLDADMAGVGARSPAELAAAAAAREHVTTSGTAAEQRAREAAAATLAQAEAERALTDAMEDRARAMDRTLASSRLEIELIGKSTAEANGLRMAAEKEADIREQAARNHVVADEAEIARMREKAMLNGKLIAQAEALNAARERDIGRQKAVSDAQHEVDIVGQTARETAYLNSVYQQQQVIKEEAIRTGQSYAEMLKREGAEIEATARKVAELTALQQARAAIETRKDDLELRRAELGLIGQAGIAREAEIERIRTEIEIRKLGIDTMGAEATRLRQLTEELNRVAEATAKKNLQDDLAFERRQIFRTPEDQEIASRLRSAGLDENLNSAEAQMIRFNQQLERMKDTWQEIFDTVDDGIDSMVDVLFDGTASWEEELKKIGRQFARQMFDLALTNPLKNWLTGANTNTIADLGLFGSGASSGRGGGFGGALGGLLGAQKAVSSMQVQAATVVVNGNLVNGIPGVTDVAGTAKAATGGGGSVLRHVGGAGSVSSNFDTAVDTITTGSTGSVTRSGRAVDLASSLTGLTENANAGQINSFLRSGGVNIDAAQTAWCAAFVNSSLKKVGIQGSNSNVATSFLDWGTHVDPSKVLRGDVLVQAKGLAAGTPGGHVGFATGDTRQSAGGLQLEMLAGNAGRDGHVGTSWYRASQLEVRRATGEAAAAVDIITTSATKAANSLAQVGLSGFEAVNGLTTAAGGLTQFGSMLKSFMGPGGGSASGWFQNLAGLAGSAAGAVSGMQAISPSATQSIIAGGALGPKGLYHTGGIAGYPSSTRYVDDGVFMNARRYHGGGLAGDEVPAILRRGEPVFPSMAAARRMFANDRGYNANRNEAPIVNLKNINVFDPSVVGDYTRTDKGEQAMINMMRRTGSARGL